MIQLVAEYEAVLAHQGGNIERVSGEAHAERDGRLDAQELGQELLQLEMTGQSAELLTRAARGRGRFVHTLYGRMRARSVVLGEAEIVVRAHVERTYDLARVIKRPVIVIGGAVQEVDLGAGHRADGSVEAVTDAVVDVACVEALVALVERHKVGRVVLLGTSATLHTGAAQEIA